MADQPSNETIRQMLSGFSAMQYNLGLLPMQQSQAMAGAPAPFQAPPPPPPVPHPSEAALAAMATHQNMVQQTLQAAQITRYQPPPSAPMPSLMSMSPTMGGGMMMGGGGGGFGAMGGFAPISGAMGGFAPFAGGGGGGGGMAGRLPSIFNPFAPTLPQAHFESPAMRNLQLMQHAQSNVMGAVAGVGSAAMGIGGSVLGGALGSMLGPLGTIAGSWLGGKIGGAVSGMIFNPVTQDFARGRQIQQMTSPFMVTGPFLNTATGQGMDPRAARDVASGIRHLQRDYDFERTGFNTADTMRIMQMSAGQGLLTGAQSPDQLVQKVKEVSKTVKVLMKITGDPDVRDAIHALGQMREMGFQGLAAQAGAVANRATFARMAGMSQAQMTQQMMMGADMAGQFGLVGATGANAAMFGVGAANVAASSGALNDLQLARAGGRGGLGQINARGSLAAMQNDQYLLAAMGRDAQGRMTVDMEAFRRAQKMDFGQVQEKAAEALRQMGTQGIFEWNTRRQEFKDQVAQKLRPGEMQMMMLRQARSFQAQVPGMTLGTALQETTGMDADQARALELQFSSRRYWEGIAQQGEARRADIIAQQRARREERRTPGLMTRMGRGVRGFMGDVSDTLSSPFRSISEHFDRVHEEEEAASRGERISRYDESAIARDDAERALLRRSMQRGTLRGIGAGPNFVDQMGTGGLTGAFGRSAGRQLNRIGSFLGLSAESDANRLAAVADYSRGRYTSLGETFGDPRDALARVQDVIEAGKAAGGTPMKGADIGTLYQRIADQGKGGHNAAAIIGDAKRNMLDAMKDMKAGYIKSARAMSGSDMRSFFISAATSKGMSQGDAEKAWANNKNQLMKEMMSTVYASGDKKLIEVLDKSQEVQTRAGAIDLSGSTKAAEEQIQNVLDKTGVGDVSDKTMSEMKAIVAHHDNMAIEMATIIRAETSGNKEEKARAATLRAELANKLGQKKFGEIQEEAQGLATSMSDKTADAFERTLRGTKDVDELNKKLEGVRDATGAKMELAAREQFKQKLDRIHKGAAGADTVEAAVGMIQEDELDKLDEKTRKAILKFKGGDKGALADVIAEAGPTSTKMRHSDASGEGLDELEDDIAQAKEEAAKASDDGTPESMQNKAATLFAESVDSFSKAVDKLSGSNEQQGLSWANPLVQARLGER